jgi:glycosyltransferase involved in cell wall biosynthesis
MKIAMVSGDANPLLALDEAGEVPQSGQNLHVSALAGELARRGHRVTIFTRKQAPGRPERARLASGVTVEQLACGPVEEAHEGRLLRCVPDFVASLRVRLEALRPDVVHAHSWLSGLAAITAAEHLDVPVVQTYHTLGMVNQRHPDVTGVSPQIRFRMELAIGNTADAVIATCSGERSALTRLGVAGGRVQVVPCGVDTEQFSRTGPIYPRGDHPRLLFLGRLVEGKGVDTVIRALHAIPGAELVVAGGPPATRLDGDPEIDRLRRISQEAMVADRVAFIGRVPYRDVPRLLRSADLVVSVPRYEPAGRVPLEAMACGVPVAVAPVGGHVDSVVDSVTGIHVPVRQPGEIARRIRDLLSDPTRRTAFGIAAADRARSRYSWERVARETQGVYSRLVEAPEALRGA